MLAVVAEITPGDAALGLDDLIADAIEECAVVADHHEGSGLLHQIALEPLDGFHIQVVCRLVKEKEVGILEKDFPEGNAHLPAAGVVAHGLFGTLRGEANRGEELVDAGFEFVAVQGFESAVQAAQFVDEFVEVLGIGRGFLAAHLVFDPALAGEHLGRFAKGLKQLLAHRAVEVNVEFLLQVGDAGVALAHHQAAGGVLHTGDDFHLGGFAGPVDADQANPISGLHFPCDIPQHLTGGINLADAFESEHGAWREPLHHPC